MCSRGARPFSGQTRTISAIAFLADREAAASAAYGHQSVEGPIRIWQVPTGVAAARLEGHRCGAFCLACSADGRTLASGGGGIVRGAQWVYDHAIRVWDLATETQTRAFGHDLFFVSALAFSPDGRLLASGSGNAAPAAAAGGASLRLWDWRSGLGAHGLAVGASSVDALCFSPDGRLLAAAVRLAWHQGVRGEAERRTLRLFDVVSREELSILEPYHAPVSSVSFSPDGTRLLSAGRELLLWDTSTGTNRRRFDTGGVFVRAAAISPDGRSARSVTRAWRQGCLPSPTFRETPVSASPSLHPLARPELRLILQPFCVRVGIPIFVWRDHVVDVGAGGTKRWQQRRLGDQQPRPDLDAVSRRTYRVHKPDQRRPAPWPEA